MHELIAIAFATIRPLFLNGTTVSTKSDASPVTLADRNAEAAMRALDRAGAIQRTRSSAKSTAVKEGRDYRWVLDPIDGTRAFITNCFLFGTLIALERWEAAARYRPVLGTIGHPAAGVALIGHQRGTTLYAGDGSSRRVLECGAASGLRMPRCLPLRTGHRANSRRQYCAHRGDCQARKDLSHLGRLLRLFRAGHGRRRLDARSATWATGMSQRSCRSIEGAGGVVSAWGGDDPLTQPFADRQRRAIASDRAIAAFRLASERVRRQRLWRAPACRAKDRPTPAAAPPSSGDAEMSRAASAHRCRWCAPSVRSRPAHRLDSSSRANGRHVSRVVNTS